MTTVIPADRPPIDPYPLSPYVAWAGKRNRDPILDVFKTLFPPAGEVYKTASGSGAHINYFAPHFKQHQFQPSDYDTDVFETIKNLRTEQGNANAREPSRSTSPSRRLGRTQAQSSMMSSSSSICFRWRRSRSSMVSRKSPPGC